MRRLKIALVCPKNPLGSTAGIESLTLNMAKVFAKNGHSTTIYTTGVEGVQSSGDVTVNSFRGVGPNFLSPGLFISLRESGADIIQVNGYNNFGMLSAMLVKKPGQKLVVIPAISQGSSLLKMLSQKIFDMVAGALSNRVDFVVSGSQYEDSFFKNLFSTPKENFDMIQYGIDMQAIRKSPGKPQPNRIISVGRLVARKGFKQLLRAVAVAAKSNPNIRLVVIGDGPEGESLRHLTSELGINGNVEFRGSIYDREKYIYELKCSSALVLLSEYAGTSLTFLEAWAAGIPVITNNHSMKEHVKEKNVVGVDYNDTASIARTINAVLSDPGKYVARNARPLSWEQMGKKMLGIYGRLLERDIPKS